MNLHVSKKNKEQLLDEFTSRTSHNTLAGEQYSAAILVKTAEDIEKSINCLKEEIHLSSEKLVKTSTQASNDSNKHSRILGWYTFGLLFVASVQVLVTIIIPWRHEINNQQDSLDSLYRSIIANQDIFIDNSNTFPSFIASSSISFFPRSYISHEISSSDRKLLQQKLGTVNFEYLLYYLDQTELLNTERNNLLTTLLTDDVGGSSYVFERTKSRYSETMEYLDNSGLDTKFNYISDTACLAFIFQESFSFIDVFDRESTLSCSSDSLQRKNWYFGKIQADTPEWESKL